MVVFTLIIFGMILGSFFCCMGMRIPHKISLIKPGSRCDNCKKALTWKMNIPIFSFIVQKGKCKYCKSQIDPICLVCEIVTPLLYVLFYLTYGVSYEFFISIIISSTIIVTIVTDFYYYYISDRVVLISYILICITNYLYFGLKYTLLHIGYSLIIVLIMIFIKILGNTAFKKESLGDGDIKLFAVSTLFHNVYLSLFVILIASFLGLIFAVFTPKNKENIIPFGPFILVSSLIVLYFTNELLTLYNIL